ncbi:MAG: cyclic dehypoxanthinyl futalosine synthase [Desulfomonilaceae bacterium]
MKLNEAIQIAEHGERLTFKAARILYEQADFLTLGQLAHKARFRHNPGAVVTFAVDRNINYTNICTSGCLFCAFWKSNGRDGAYVLDDRTLAKKLEETKALGGTHILLQGGLNPDLDLEWHESHIRMIRSFGLHLHGYSPPEINFFARQSGLSVEEVLKRFIAEGLSSIPGGGAEILSDRVRRIVSPRKGTSKEWLHVMATAHQLGLKTTATMMFGHVETSVERLTHLFVLRSLQEKTGGFTAFIPWPYQPGRDTVPAKPTGGTAYLRMLAMSRLVLDNFPHVQSSWVTQGPGIGQVALFFGADDLGSTMIEENVVAAAGVSHRLSREEMVRLIEAAGFTAHQRDNTYQAARSAP